MSKSISVLVLALYGCAEGNPFLDFSTIEGKERETSSITPFIENKQAGMFGFVDRNPSSETYGQKYSFVLEGEKTKQRQHEENTLYFSSLAKTIVFNWFEPWCFPCMEELPDLERLVVENGVPVFGFTTDYQKFPSSNGRAIEDAISYPIFVVDSENEVYKSFLRQLNPKMDPNEEMPEEGVEQFIPSVEMPILPRTLFVYGENRYCLRTAGETYETFLEQAKNESCPQTILIKVR